MYNPWARVGQLMFMSGTPFMFAVILAMYFSQTKLFNASGVMQLALALSAGLSMTGALLVLRFDEDSDRMLAKFIAVIGVVILFCIIVMALTRAVS